MPFERKVTFYGYDLDENSRLRISSVMHNMQQVAREDLEIEGLGYEIMREHGYVFVLTKMRMEFSSVPESYKKTFVLGSVAREIRGATFFRDFRMNDSDEGGAPVMSASSTWALMDYNARRPLRPTALFKMNVHHPELSVGFDPERGIAVSDGLVKTDERRIYRSMLDENRHLNNCVYADILFDYAKNTYASPSIQIDFCGEAHEDDIVSIYAASGENFDFVTGFNETREKKCFDAIVRECRNTANSKDSKRA